MNEHSNRPNIIITGSNGFIGNAIIDRLREKYNIIGFDKNLPEKSNADANFEVDIGSSENILNTLEKFREQFGHKIASVIHLAAYYSFSEEESPLYDKITVKGTESLITHLKQYDVEQFIFSSTMLVHRPLERGKKIQEDSHIYPSWAYPKSKIDAEKILREQHEHIPLVNLRIAGVYDDRCHSVPISNQIMRVYERQFSSRLYPGDATKGQTFLHIEDLVDAVEKIVEQRQVLPSHVDLLLGEAKAISYADLQNGISNLLHGRDWNSLKVPLWFAKTGSWIQHHTPLMRKPFIMPWMIDFTNDHYELDIGRAKKLLNWKPKHDIKKTIPSMIKTLRKNPRQFYKENKLTEASSLARLFGRMPGDETGFELPSKGYVNQLNTFNLLNILLAVWLISDSVTRTTSSAMIISSVLSGLLVIILSILAYIFLWQWPRWCSALLGFWILFAPLVFWSESAADYSGGNLIGFLITLCGAFRPLRVVRSLRPEGWDYNPSTWQQRIPIVSLAFIGFFIARYMAAYQLGHINAVWDPIFGNQTATILSSDVSKAFPVSDAGLGAFSYLVDAVSGLIGDKNRWRTMPWMVVLFGIMIIPPGVTSIVLVILQPVAVNAWCFLCLFASVIMLLMVAPAMDEVIATIQFLSAQKKSGKPFWKTFIQGVSVEKLTPEETISVELQEKEISKKERPKAPLGLVGTIILSTGLMFIPEFYNIAKPASNIIYFSTSLILTFAIIAMSEVARPVRIINVLLGVILLAGMWITEGVSSEMKLIVSVIALTIIILSLPAGSFRHHYGAYDKIAHWTLMRFGRRV